MRCMRFVVLVYVSSEPSHSHRPPILLSHGTPNTATHNTPTLTQHTTQHKHNTQKQATPASSSTSDDHHTTYMAPPPPTTRVSGGGGVHCLYCRVGCLLSLSVCLFVCFCFFKMSDPDQPLCARVQARGGGIVAKGGKKERRQRGQQFLDRQRRTATHKINQIVVC
jgi:hypothetical protein